MNGYDGRVLSNEGVQRGLATVECGPLVARGQKLNARLIHGTAEIVARLAKPLRSGQGAFRRPPRPRPRPFPRGEPSKSLPAPEAGGSPGSHALERPFVFCSLCTSRFFHLIR